LALFWTRDRESAERPNTLANFEKRLKGAPLLSGQLNNTKRPSESSGPRYHQMRELAPTQRLSLNGEQRRADFHV
jgi:hypothetical protein